MRAVAQAIATKRPHPRLAVVLPNGQLQQATADTRKVCVGAAYCSPAHRPVVAHSRTTSVTTWIRSPARFFSSRTSQPIVVLNNGQSVPQFGLGTWRSAPEAVAQAVDHAVRVGYRHIDCAAIYANEHEVGTAVAGLLKDGIVRREELCIVSKLWNTKHHPADVETAVRETLSDLKISYLDMYLMHWPVAFSRGEDPYPQTPDGLPAIEDIPTIDTWHAMETLLSKGLVKSIGVCNFTETQLRELVQGAAIPPVVNQVECHPYWPQHSLRRACRSLGVHLTAYSPLGARNRHSPRVDVELLQHPTLLEAAATLATSHGTEVTPAQLLCRWSLQLGNLCIPKSITASRIESNIECLRLPLLDDALMQTIESISQRPVRLLNPMAFRNPPSPFFCD